MSATAPPTTARNPRRLDHPVRSAGHRRLAAAVLVAGACLAGTVLSLIPTPSAAACHRTAREWYNPSGWEGCVRYGTGIASHYPGPGVARNDCLYPWDQCEPITITALDTGRSITVTPTMFGDLYTNTADERIVDLDPTAVRALGLEWADGLYPVTVEPAALTALPDTAVEE